MNHTVLIFVAIAVLIAVGYILVMRVFFVEGKELDKKIDYSKVKPWKDDD